MTARDALDRVNGETPPSAFKTVMESRWIQLALMCFAVGAAWSDLHATVRENKMDADARFAVMASDLHVLKVLACKSYPHDSVCAAP